MAGTITRGNLPRLLVEGINKVFGQTYTEHPVEWTKILDTETSKKAFELDQMVEGMGLAGVKPEGSDVPFDDFRQSFSPKYNHLTYAKGFVVTQEALEDELYGVMSKKARMLAFSMRQTEEIVGANILNRGFNSAFQMTDGDGQALFSTAHPLGPSGGTFSNVLATAADLSEASIEDLVIQIGKAVDSRGLKINIRPKRLIVPVALQFEAARILKSTLQNDTANNAINALKEMSIFTDGMAVNHYLTSDDAWFIKTDCMDGLKRFNRTPVRFGEDNAFLSGNARFKAEQRYSVGWSDSRGAYGSQGTA